MSPRTYQPGSTLLQQGTLATGLLLIESGSVRILLPTADGREQLLDVAGAGSILGLSDCLSGGTYRVTAQAEEYTVAHFIPGREFINLLDANRELWMEIVRALSESLHGLYHRFRSVCARPGRPRRRSLDETLH